MHGRSCVTWHRSRGGSSNIWVNESFNKHLLISCKKKKKSVVPIHTGLTLEYTDNEQYKSPKDVQWE